MCNKKEEVIRKDFMSRIKNEYDSRKKKLLHDRSMYSNYGQ